MVSLVQPGTLESFSSDIYRLLHLCDEEDDATSQLAAPKPEPNDQIFQVGESLVFPEVRTEDYSFCFVW